MAKRPVFIPQGEVPFARAIETEFSWNGGFAPSQKQKNIRALHGAFLAAHPDARVLEISSKSMQENGPALSAFALAKYVPALGRSVPVENVFQAGKVFEGGGRARFVSLHRLGLLKKPFSFEDFLRRMGE